MTIKIGKDKDGTTNFTDLICPYCESVKKWDEFYSDIDVYDVLDTDASVTNTYVCPECKNKMYVCLDVLVRAEKM